MSEKQKDGKSLRDHLENVQRQTGNVPEELEDLTTLPEGMMQCWGWFLDLNRTRQSGMSVCAISFTEMQSYFTLHKIEALLEEIEVIKMFDIVAGISMQDQQEKVHKSPKQKEKQNE